MQKLGWLKPLSIILSVSLVPWSVFWFLLPLLLPESMLAGFRYRYFFSIEAYAIPVWVCTIIGRHRAAVVFGSAAAMAYLALYLVDRWHNPSGRVYDNLIALHLVPRGVPFILALLAAALCHAIIRTIEKRGRV